MSTNITPDISKRNAYWLPRERYYELKWFCLQYNSWKSMLPYISGLSRIEHGTFISAYSGGRDFSDPVSSAAFVRSYFTARIEMVEKAAKESAPSFWEDLLFAVTTTCSYETLILKRDIPCGKELYYKCYRKFFWILSSYRQ